MVKMTREQLGVQAGDSIVIKGTVSFARVDKLVEGEALAAENARRKNMNMMAADKPFRSITIEDPTIVQGQGTPLAQFHGQNVYTSGAGKLSMSLESKSLYPPKFGHIQNGVLVEIADPQKNPAPGQEVFLMIEAYGSKSMSNAKLGSSFNAIAYPEGEIKFYESTGGGGLTGFGQALNLQVQNLDASPQAQPAAQNSGFGTQPVQSPAGQNDAFGQAVPPNQDSNFGQAAPQTAPAQDANPFTGFGQQPAQPDQTTGRSNNPFA